jgi:outer membrane protein
MQHAIIKPIAAGILAAGVAATANAAGNWPEAGDWLVRGGFQTINPDGGAFNDGDGLALEVGSDTAFVFSGNYFLTPSFALELQGSTRFNHDVDLVGVGKVATAKHVPVTLSLQYHFDAGAFKPYAGVGLNYTVFRGEDTTGVLGGVPLSLANSRGLAGQVGVDYAMSDRWYLNGEVRYIDMDTTATLDGSRLGTISVDPWVWSLNVGRRF